MVAVAGCTMQQGELTIPQTTGMNSFIHEGGIGNQVAVWVYDYYVPGWVMAESAVVNEDNIVEAGTQDFVYWHTPYIVVRW